MSNASENFANVVMTSDWRSGSRFYKGILVVTLGATALIFLRWVQFLFLNVPDISRADFLWAMSHRMKLIETGEWLRVVGSWFELFGGHIVVYTRAIQTINYIAADYSGVLIKWVAISVYILAVVAFSFMIRREFKGRPLSGAVLFFIGVLLICSPVPYEVIAWPEAVPPYFSCFIAGCFALPYICEKLDGSVPSVWQLFLIGIATLSILVGSGVGWSILPLIPIIWIVASGRLDRCGSDRRSLAWLLIGLVLAVVAAMVLREVLLSLMRSYEKQFWLRHARSGLAGVFDDPLIVMQFFLGLLATTFGAGKIAITWLYGAVELIIWLVLLAVLARLKLSARNTIWIVFSVFGLLSAVLTTLTRWQLFHKRGIEQIWTYYSIFVLPFHIGLLGMSFGLLDHYCRRKRGAFHVGVVAPALLIVFVAGCAVYARRDSAFRLIQTQAEWHLAARFGAQNWSLFYVARLSGASEFAQQYLLELMPAFKLAGKYKKLTSDFIADPTEFASAESIPQPVLVEGLPEMKSPGRCFEEGDGIFETVDPDQRAQWFLHEKPVRFIRFFGYARNPEGCDGSRVDHVIAVDKLGRILCVSRTGRNMWWDLPLEWKKRPISRSQFVFDFSCPLVGDLHDADRPYSVIAHIRDRKLLMRIPQAP